jgi:hypothetical protein
MYILCRFKNSQSYIWFDAKEPLLRQELVNEIANSWSNNFVVANGASETFNLEKIDEGLRGIKTYLEKEK